MKIVIRPHLKTRLKQREIPADFPEKAIKSSKSARYIDNTTNHHIAVRKLKYYEKVRPMAVAYDIIGSTIQAITVYPTDTKEIQNRLKSGRWSRNEKN